MVCYSHAIREAKQMIVTSSHRLFARFSHVLPRGDCHAHQNGSCIFPSMTISFLVARDVVFTVFQFFMGNLHGVMFWRFVAWWLLLFLLSFSLVLGLVRLSLNPPGLMTTSVWPCGIAHALVDLVRCWMMVRLFTRNLNPAAVRLRCVRLSVDSSSSFF